MSSIKDITREGGIAAVATVGVDAETVRVERTARDHCSSCLPGRLGRCENAVALNGISPAEGNSDIVPRVENGESMEVKRPCGESPTFPTTPPIQTEASLLPEPIRMNPPDFLWAEMAGHGFGLKLEAAYLEILNWLASLSLLDL